MEQFQGALFLDVETATTDRNSICQFSYLIVDNENNVIKEYNSLVKPFKSYHQNEFEFTYVHNLKWDDVKNERSFDAVWAEVQADFAGQYLVFAHNANFDMGCLKDSLAARQISYQPFAYACTYFSLRKIRPDLKVYKLDHLAKINGIIFNHHDALEDVKATFKIFTVYFNTLPGFLKISQAFNYQIKKI
jgi:DNA polymerase-3 subunit epsilon